MTDCAHRFEKLHFKFDGTPILFCPECGQEEADRLTAPVVLVNAAHSHDPANTVGRDARRAAMARFERNGVTLHS